MLSHQQQDLWNRIRNFLIDDPLAHVKYSDKLAHVNGWTKDYTERVIEEYRKFIFLCDILPNGASPSKPIDEAWHLHLTYTQNYWKGLCEGVLGKEIHHFPSRGGSEENEKHIKWYNATLEAYREIFGHEAPSDIWTQQEKKPVSKMIHKEEWQYLNWYKNYFGILVIPFVLIVALYNEINPYNLNGTHFLVFYGIFSVVVIVYLSSIHLKKKKELKELVAENYEGDADLFQLARFVYGRERSFRAAIIDLVERKILEPQRKSKFIFYGSRYKYSSSENNPLIIHLLRNIGDGATLHYNELSSYYDDAATYHPGLSGLYQSLRQKDLRPLLFTISAGLIGIARIIQGSYNDKPVGYLFTMCVFLFLLSVYFIAAFSAMNILRKEFASDFNNRSNPAFETTALASAFVFLGLSSISGMTGYNRIQSTFSKNSFVGDSSGGYGSSGCGGSGCGSSCSGGCGGCGGGD